jgi:predicted acylesterase/phospholipase RssA
MAASMERIGDCRLGFSRPRPAARRRLARYVRERTGGRSDRADAAPLGIVAADLDSGQAVLFRAATWALAVRASSAVPAVFQPVSIGGREYVDGGLVAPVPVAHARQMGADLVIAVDIGEAPEGKSTGDPFRLLLQTFAIMGAASAATNCATPMSWSGRRWRRRRHRLPCARPAIAAGRRRGVARPCRRCARGSPP